MVPKPWTLSISWAQISATAWSTKSPDQIVRDMNSLLTGIKTATKEVAAASAAALAHMNGTVNSRTGAPFTAAEVELLAGLDPAELTLPSQVAQRQNARRQRTARLTNTHRNQLLKERKKQQQQRYHSNLVTAYITLRTRLLSHLKILVLVFLLFAFPHPIALLMGY